MKADVDEADAMMIQVDNASAAASAAASSKEPSRMARACSFKTSARGPTGGVGKKEEKKKMR
jgi:hypothetical protein